MTKKRKINRARNSKPRSFSMMVLGGIGRFIGWLFKLVFRHARNNPLLAVGYCLFFISFSFITYNALFSQTERNHGVFIETRPLLLKMASERAAQTPVTTSTRTPTIFTTKPKVQTTGVDQVDDDTSLPKNIADIQKKLANLGIYQGSVDGLDGPRTRNAIAVWQQRYGEKSAKAQTNAKSADDIASLIEGQSPVQPVDKITTRALPENKGVQPKLAEPLVVKKEEKITSVVSESQSMSAEHKVSEPLNSSNSTLGTADVMRVQAALRAFGNVDVDVTGKEDSNTAQALSQFQKMFSLSVTGKVNQEVLDKMHEIGLIG